MRPVSPPTFRHAHLRAGGFTLVEVLVALFVMALMAALAWRGLDGVLRGRDAGQASVDRTVLLSTLMSQWETDLHSLQPGAGVPALSFDGRTLRLVRRTGTGLQLVAWSLNGSTWQRWASAPTTRTAELQQAWLRSQQLLGTEPEQLTLLDGVGDWQIYFYRGNAWTNAQSTGDLAPGADGTAAAAGRFDELLPSGVRLLMQIDGLALTRDIAVAPSS
jgi:general secretion pathway protein J